MACYAGHIGQRKKISPRVNIWHVTQPGVWNDVIDMHATLGKRLIVTGEHNLYVARLI